MARRRPTPGPALSLHRLPPPSPEVPAPTPGELPGEVVVVTHAVRGRWLRAGVEHRPGVIAAIVG
jgi:hypothetical protein